MTLHIGFTGTRHGMSAGQRARVESELRGLVRDQDEVFAHHGLCVGGDAEFHRLMRRVAGAEIHGHPGPNWPHGNLCAHDVLCDWVHDPLEFMARNAVIVRTSSVMIAAPYEDTPQPRGGTWGTIAMARKALAAGKLERLIVVGRDGRLIGEAGR